MLDLSAFQKSSIFLQEQSTLLEHCSRWVACLEERDLVSGEFVCILGQKTFPRDHFDSKAIKLNAMQIGKFTPKDTPPANDEFVAAALSVVYQRNWTEHLLDSILKPIDITQTDDAYINEISEMLLRSMRAKYIVVRFYKFVEGARALECKCFIDRTNELKLELPDLDIDSKSNRLQLYQDIEHDFRQRPEYLHFIYKKKNPRYFDGIIASRNRGLQTVLIAPLSIGNEVKGFINIGYDIYFSLNGFMRVAFAAILNHACAAIENAQKIKQIHRLRQIQMRDYVESLHNELLQGFRHTAQTAIFTADHARQRIKKFYNYRGDPKQDPLNELERQHQEIEVALSNMASLRSFDEGKEDANLFEILQESFSLMKVPLESAKVTWRINPRTGDRVRALVNRDAVKTAFANMILNSIQAFQESNSKIQDRKITVSIEKSDRTIQIDFADDGPGIRIPSGAIRTIGDIWEPGKTSKKNGTGNGLTMVREVFQVMHNGSIDLRDSNRGARFRIVLDDGLKTAA